MIEIFIHHIIDIDQHNAHEVLHVGLAHELETQTQLHQGQTVRPVGVHQLWRAAAIQFKHQLAKNIHLLTKGLKSGLVFGPNTCTTQKVAIDTQMITIGLQCHRALTSTHL